MPHILLVFWGCGFENPKEPSRRLFGINLGLCFFFLVFFSPSNPKGEKQQNLLLTTYFNRRPSQLYVITNKKNYTLLARSKFPPPPLNEFFCSFNRGAYPKRRSKNDLQYGSFEKSTNPRLEIGPELM